MKPLSRISLYALAAVLLSVSLVIVFHNTLARWIAATLVQHVPGIEVKFDGPFDVTHVVPLTLDVAGVSVAFTGDEWRGSRARFGTVQLRMRLWPLVRGIVHIERLRIADANVEIARAGAVKADQSASALHLPVVEQLRFDRVRVRFEREADQSPHELTIAALQLDESEDGDLTATGTADLDGCGLALEARFGSVEQLLRPTASFPVDAILRAPSWDLEARATGALEGPLGGRSARLDVRATTSDIRALRSVFFPDAPFAGSVDAKAHLSGNLDAPALSDIGFTIDDEDRLRFALNGSIADLRRLDGLELQVEAVAQDPAITRYLSQEVMPTAQTARFRAAVRGKAHEYLLEGIDVEMSGKTISQ